METYWKLNDPYWYNPMPYTQPIFPLYEEKSQTKTTAGEPLFGLTRRTAIVAAGMVGAGLVVGVLVGYMTSAGDK